MSRMSVCSLKNLLTSQEEVGYAAAGSPQASGSGVGSCRSEGMESRGKNHMYIPDEFQLSAYTPPLEEANDLPYDLPGVCTMQP